MKIKTILKNYLWRGLVFILSGVLITLKAANIISLSWFWVFSPIWITAILLILFALLAVWASRGDHE